MLFRSKVKIKNNSYEITKLGQTGTKSFKSFKEATEHVYNLLNESPKVKLDPQDLKLLGTGSAQVKLKVSLKGTLPDEALANTSLLAKLASSDKGRYTSMKVKTFSTLALKNLGVESDVLRTLEVKTIGDKIEVYLQDKLIHQVPKVVSSAKEELSNIQNLIKELKTFAPKNAKANTVITSNEIVTAQTKMGNYYLPLLDRLAQKKFGANLVQKEGKFILVNPKKPNASLVFDSYDEAGNYILRNFVTEKTLRLSLKQTQGLSMVRDIKTNEVKLRRKGKTLGVYKDIDTLMAENPELIPKISPDLGPQVALVNKDQIQVTYGKDSVEGTYQDILKTLDSFADYEAKTKSLKLGVTKKSTISVNPVSKTIEVEIPEISYRKTFKTVKEAKQFINEGWLDRTNLDTISADKGYRIEISGGKYFLYGEKNVTFVASTKKELEQILDTAPIPEWAKEYSGLDSNIVDMFDKPPGGMFKPVEFKIKSEKLGPVVSISHAYRPPDAWLVSAIEHGGDQNILGYFRKIDSTMQFLTAEEGKVAKPLVGMWQKYKRSKRVLIGELLEIPEEQWAAEAVKRSLKPGEIETAKAMRKYFNIAAQRFDVGYEKFIKDYLPRMRKAYLKDPGKYHSDSSMVDFIRDSFGGNVPTDLDAFFKHQRVRDVVNFIREDDPLTLGLKYNAIGQREAFLGKLWNEADAYLKQNKNTVDPILKIRFNAYRSDLMGIPAGMGEKSLLEFSKRFYQGLKGTNITPGLANDLTKAMMTWGYLSAMGFRIWLPIRNMFQVWTTLAPRIGNSWVSEAINIVSKDKPGKIFQMLKDRGIISENLPLYGANIIDSDKALSHLLHKGLKWYKNSDEWTRAVAYTASQLRFKDAVSRFSKGYIKEKNFMELSGLGMMPTDLKNEALSFIRAGKWNNAEDTFARMMTTDTMFSYRAGMAPTSFRGAVGKLFGMMGHYPVYYLENVKRALKYSTFPQKVAYGARFVGNSMALYTAFHDVLGINATNFLPWTPALFSGGPYYQLMNEALMASGKGYQAREARAKLFGIKSQGGHLAFNPVNADITAWGMPMGFLVKNVAKGIKHLEEGDDYLAFLAFTTAPINPDLLQ